MTPKRKKAAAAILISGITVIMIGLLLPVIASEYAPASSVGIIGGADFPTYAFLLMRIWGGLPFALVMIGFAAVSVGAIVLTINPPKE